MLHRALKMGPPIVAILVAMFGNIVESNKVPSESIDLVKNIYEYYKPSGIIVVYDAHDERDFNMQKSLFSVIRQFSRDYLMSQAVSYQQVGILIRYTSPIEDDEYNSLRCLQSLDPLYMLIIEKENLQYFKTWSMNLTAGRDAPPWFIYFVNRNENLNYYDCAEPQGNPFSLVLNSRVMVKCSDDKYLRRYYSVLNNETKVHTLDHWTPGTALSIKDMKNEYHKSNPMNWKSNFTIRIAKPKARSAGYTNNQDEFANEILNVMDNMSLFNFEVVVEGKVFGYRISKRKWFGLMKTMEDNEADMIAALTSMSKTRMLVVDFTIPLLQAKSGIYAKLPDFFNIQWSAYFDVLGSHAWMTITGLVIIISIVLGLLKQNFTGFTIPLTLFFENIIKVWSVFMQQGLSGEVCMTTAVQILYFFMFISALILNAVYSASITSYIAVMKISLPFSSYSDFLKDKEYKVLVLSGSRDEDLVLSHDDELMSPLKSRLVKKDLRPTNEYDGFVQACQKNYAVYSNDINYDGITMQLPCTLGFLKSPRPDFLSFATVKMSPYTNTINFFVLRLINNGIISRLRNKYFYKYTELVESKSNTITLWEIVPILLIWGMGILISFTILFLEIALHRLHRRLRKRNRVNYLNFLQIKIKKLTSSR